MSLRFSPKIAAPIIAGLMFIGMSSIANNEKSQPKTAVSVKINSPFLRISCAGVKPWDAATTYTGGQTVVYNGRLYKARWWTQGESPASGSGSAFVWQDMGACD